MSKIINFNLWLGLGVILELIILGYCYEQFSSDGEVYRHAARYSGRLSLLVYLFCFYYFATTGLNNNLKRYITIFCILHFIHFSFLAANVYLNHIELIPYKLLGGFLAYLMILIYPFVFNRPNLPKFTPYVYFYYVGIVMAITYVSRIKGNFEGVTPSYFHYFGLGSVIIAFVAFGIMLRRNLKA